jgi:hypothetical protein
LFLKHAEKLGVLDGELPVDDRAAPVNKVRPSELLLNNVDPDLLSREEQVELSKLAAEIDRAGDIFALSPSALSAYESSSVKAAATSSISLGKPRHEKQFCSSRVAPQLGAASALDRRATRDPPL